MSCLPGGLLRTKMRAPMRNKVRQPHPAPPPLPENCWPLGLIVLDSLTQRPQYPLQNGHFPEGTQGTCPVPPQASHVFHGMIFQALPESTRSETIKSADASLCAGDSSFSNITPSDLEK